MIAELDPVGLAVFVAVVAAVAALANGSPEQWGWRRVSFGVVLVMGGLAAVAISNSALWWGCVAWGAQQVHLGWSFVSRRRRSSHERVVYLEATAAVLAYTALSDGVLAPKEADIIRTTYRRAGFEQADLGHVERVLEECQARHANAASDPSRLFILLKDACEIVRRHSNPQTRSAFFEAAIDIASSDGFISLDEHGALRAVQEWLAIAPDDAERIWRRSTSHSSAGRGYESGHTDTDRDGRGSESEAPVVPPDLATYYAGILGVAVTASPQDLRRAYREKAKQYHPDVVAHRGAEFARMAEEEFKEISAAYDYLRGASASV